MEPVQAAAGLDWDALWLSLGLLALAVAFLVAEIFIVSFGILFAASAACAIGSIYYAFVADDAIGWTLAVLVPVLGAALVRWGLERIRSSRHLVPLSEVTADAGYHHFTERVGAVPGATGVMVTDAYPSGRARFEGGECDVQVQGGSLERGARVEVRRVDGPIVFVAPVADGTRASER